MPTYEYKCESCGHLEEVFARMSDPPPAACESCKSTELVKVLFPVAVHYKGSGFYSTDYTGRGSAGSSSSESGESSSSSSSSSEGGSSSGGESSSTSSSSPKETGSSGSSSSSSSDG